MVFGKYRRKMDDYSLALKISTLVNIILIILLFGIFSFALKIYSDRQVIVKIPPQIPGNNTLVLGVNTASVETIRIFSTYFGQLIGNYTPGSVEDRLKSLFQYLSPNIEINEKLRFYKNINHVRENQIEQKFVVNDVDVKNRGNYFDIVVKGTVDRRVGDFENQILKIPYLYKMAIAIRNGSPYIMKPIKSEFLVDKRVDRLSVKSYKEDNIYIEYK